MTRHFFSFDIAMISQLPDILNQEIQDIRMNAHIKGKEEVHDTVREVLYNDWDVQQALEQWMSANINTSASKRKHPDEGALSDIQKSMMVALVVGDVDAMKAALKVYESMLTELQDDFLCVPPPRNLFERNGSIAGTFKPHSNHRAEQQTTLSDLSDLSDLTDISESEDDMRVEANEIEAKETDMEHRENEQYIENLRQALTWKDALTKITGISAKEHIRETEMDGVVTALRAMKKVARSRYSTETFRRAIRESGLAEEIATISDPMFTILNRNEQILWLAHVYRVGDQLAAVLERWTPSEIARTWEVTSTRFLATQTGKQAIRTPKDFLDVFEEHPEYVPGPENLSYCFFMSSLSNFQYNYDIWLGRLLEHLEYDVRMFNDEREMEKFYGRLIWLIHEWCTQPQHTFEGQTAAAIDAKTFQCERWKTIIKNTASLRQIANETSAHARKLSRCKTCLGLAGEERCCQYINKPHITRGLEDEEAKKRLDCLIDELTGAGVTMVPERDRVKPKLPDEGRKQRLPAGTGRLYHPDSIGETAPFKLYGLEPEESIVARCGHQLLLVLDEEVEAVTSEARIVDWDRLRKDEIVDFMWWGPFDADKLALLQDAVVESTGVQSVSRGGQFQSFAGGKMTPIGSRSPSGGRAGDTYTSYAGLDATTEEGLNILFKQAATSVMMQEAALQVHPNLARELKRIGRECDRMGMTGANIFNCTGYMAPIHRDKDASRGLCAQALLSADTTYREFSFCNIEYQYYIVTRTNCLWSFKSSNLHGTMLPSSTTIANLNSRAVDPMRTSAVPPTDGDRRGSLWEYTSLAPRISSLNITMSTAATSSQGGGENTDSRGRRGGQRGGRARGGRRGGTVVAGSELGNRGSRGRGRQCQAGTGHRRRKTRDAEDRENRDVRIGDDREL
ncbi:hypothetical protein F5878DRAFT_702347 [Lentinula raphanica]|uniref:Uncharacterized protein n=1 Tax=Lentinula raphanica TaxID=153919 RepID=A0AA38PF91_9AGAR|nr:hypothetical protein F5878DRAFT_702347 [Lentinula raphanica]